MCDEASIFAVSVDVSGAAMIHDFKSAITVLIDVEPEAFAKKVALENRNAACRYFCIWMEHNNVLSHSRHARITD